MKARILGKTESYNLVAVHEVLIRCSMHEALVLLVLHLLLSKESILEASIPQRFDRVLVGREEGAGIVGLTH